MNSDIQQVQAAWARIEQWLAEHAPRSHRSLLPPAPEGEIDKADAELRRQLGFGLPVELVALWRMCGGVEHQVIEEDEQGEVGSGAFLPGGIILPPAEALGPRLPGVGRQDPWGGLAAVPCFTQDEAGPESGHWVSDDGMGLWYLSEPPHDIAQFPSMATYFDEVFRTLTEGPADRMGSDVPGLVWGCLIWDDPTRQQPWRTLDEASAHWRPVH
ncbi:MULTISPECIES: hypothetical protein [unclassified Streptomyces]|uniref:hypothetical protein n=1 Tax=Streptomyces TaxID=1883 RepID=UPI00136C4231|nr:hypothetical protein [Streptomyces sp. SID335]MYZ14504.1 hypothetical protein [Streptomyces sp. SID337]NDZ92047.1 hypothetical protein [Streptomyces sp. SID10115]NEA03634.1 hypothetical protein [Streptomyces sp. SID10116]NEB50363.1 hypothetical protein [Streptomyces sp. SID339]